MRRCAVNMGHVRAWLPPVVIALGLTPAFLENHHVAAEDPPDVVARVEEDWELQIGVPDPNNDAPQIVNVISPSQSLDGWHGVFEVNHQTLPDFSAGGMGLQVWNGECNRDFRVSQSLQVLANEEETVRYTLALSVGADTLRLEVFNGSSQTWGQFGGSDTWQLAASTSVTNLNGYSPFTSLTYSRVAFGANRVKRFSLQTVRFYGEDGHLLATLHEDALTPPSTTDDASASGG